MRGGTERGGANERAFDTRLLKAGLGLCVLALLDERPRHGYDLARELGELGVPLVNDRSVYPLLGKMREEGLLRVEGLVQTGNGPARKYYALTQKGEATLDERAQAFLSFARLVGEIVCSNGRTRN